MKLTHCCIITEDVIKLRDFYESILKLKSRDFNTDYAEFHTGNGILGVFDIEYHNKLAPNSAIAKNNKTVLLEFNVDDVEQEYERLKSMNIKIIKELRTHPWGSRSFYFLDPDGNMINFYTKV